MDRFDCKFWALCALVVMMLARFIVVEKTISLVLIERIPFPPFLIESEARVNEGVFFAVSASPFRNGLETFLVDCKMGGLMYPLFTPGVLNFFSVTGSSSFSFAFPFA